MATARCREKCRTTSCRRNSARWRGRTRSANPSNRQSRVPRATRRRASTTVLDIPFSLSLSLSFLRNPRRSSRERKTVSTNERIYIIRCVSFSSGETQRRRGNRVVSRPRQSKLRRERGDGATKGRVDSQIYSPRARDAIANAAARARAGGAAEADGDKRAEGIRDQEATDREPGRRVLQVLAIIRHLPNAETRVGLSIIYRRSIHDRARLPRARAANDDSVRTRRRQRHRRRTSATPRACLRR